MISIAKALDAAREAVSLGQDAKVSEEVDTMKRRINAVSKLMANATLNPLPKQESIDGQSLLQGGDGTVSGGAQARRLSISLPQTSNLMSNFTVGIPSLTSSTLSSLDQGAGNSIGMDFTDDAELGHSPDSDGSRKRCASSIATTTSRINKAIRLASDNGNGMPPLTQPATPPAPRTTASIASGQMLPPTRIPGVLPSGIPVSATLASGPLSAPLPPIVLPLRPVTSPSAPPSRPDSPTVSLASSQPGAWPILTQQSLSSPASVTPGFTSLPPAQSGFPMPLNLAGVTAMPITDAGGPGSAGLGSPAKAASGWPEMLSSLPVSPAGVSMTAAQNAIDVLGTGHPQDIAGPSSVPFGSPPYLSMASGSSIPASALNRSSRSSSLSNSLTTPLSNPLVYGATSQVVVPPPTIVPSQSRRARTRSRPSLPMDLVDATQDDDDLDIAPESGRRGYPLSKEDRRDSPPYDGRDSSPSRARQSGEPNDQLSTNAGHGNEIPQECRADVDRIFFEFLTNVCSNRRSNFFYKIICLYSPSIYKNFYKVDATDGKGESIHQTLMAKKMQRLDESPDFRPFKFRIQAFTNAFLEEVSYKLQIFYPTSLNSHLALASRLP